MKCPLLMQQLMPYSRAMAKDESNCLKEECAWYREQAQACVIYILTNDIRELRDTMNAIKEKMPHEEQFGK